MILAAAWAALAASGGEAPPPAAPADAAPVELADTTIIIRRRIVVRVPVPAAAPPAPVRYRERKGPRCVDQTAIAGAAIVDEESVDMIFRGGLRVRAKLDSACPALGFYRGFYIRPTEDGRICADRDAIHTRAGGECEIQRFRLLVPAGTP